MALPWLVAVAAEYVVLRRFFRRDPAAAATARDPGEPPRLPLFAVVTVACPTVRGGDGRLLARRLRARLGARQPGLAAKSAASARLDPAWSAPAGALVLADRGLVPRRATPLRVVRAAPSFLVFVLALGVVVRAVVDNGLANALGHVIPDGTSLPTPLGLAALTAAPANLINNLAAALVLLPLALPSGPGGARRPARREHRPHPHLRRLPGHAAVAPYRAPARPRRRPRGVHPARSDRSAGARTGAVPALWASLQVIAA